jgi:hypothetical protein
MSKIGLGYGSEWHLMRFLGRHRVHFNDQITKVLLNDGVDGIQNIQWLDFNFDPKNDLRDGEIMGMDFLPSDYLKEWKDFWPDKKAGKIDINRSVQTWDAIGRLYTRGGL